MAREPRPLHNLAAYGLVVSTVMLTVAVSHRPGKVHQSHRLSRGRFQQFFIGRESVEILMEACGTAHHWGRTFCDVVANGWSLLKRLP